MTSTDNSPAPATGGVLLMAAAAMALVVANSPASGAYVAALARHAGPLTIVEWINDALMALFFLLVGLGIKREWLTGQLSTAAARVLPGIAALGGMVVPALIYLAINLRAGGAPRGWAIPAATDIAFALGVLALLGSRVPASLKLFLTALAIIDDLGAVLIIAAFYTDRIDPVALAGAAVAVAGLVALNRRGVASLAPYLVLGAALWCLFLRAGVHATLAGVVLAFAIPLRVGAATPLARLEHALQPWVAFAIVPLFGFANAGVSFAGMDTGRLVEPVVLGVALGLFVGKQVGVASFAWLAVRLRWSVLPAGASRMQFHGVAILCGIGFTMSLFIGLLAFPGDARLHDDVRLGMLTGSIASSLLGAALLWLTRDSESSDTTVIPSSLQWTDVPTRETLMTDKHIAEQADRGNMEKDPADWVTGDEPMTGAQMSYLKTLSEEAKQPFDETLSKAQASERIDALQAMTGRGQGAASNVHASDVHASQGHDSHDHDSHGR